jgi:hypothetical protein
VKCHKFRRGRQGRCRASAGRGRPRRRRQASVVPAPTPALTPSVPKRCSEWTFIDASHPRQQLWHVAAREQGPLMATRSRRKWRPAEPRAPGSQPSHRNRRLDGLPDEREDRAHRTVEVQEEVPGTHGDVARAAAGHWRLSGLSAAALAVRQRGCLSHWAGEQARHHQVQVVVHAHCRVRNQLAQIRRRSPARRGHCLG